MSEVIHTTGDVFALQEVEVQARRMTEDQEFTYVGVPSTNAEEAFRWNFEVIQSLETLLNYFQLDIGERMRLYDKNMR